LHSFPGRVDANAVDCNGDLALHDASRFKHEAVIKALEAATKDTGLKNKAGQTPADLRNL
jgi:ankyrin repeat protein